MVSAVATTYVTDALAFDLPVEAQTVEDRTVHELAIPGAETPFDLLLTIGRERLVEGRDLAAAVGALHDRERRELAGFTVVEETTRRLGAVDWIDTQVTWKHPNGPVYHRRLHGRLGDVWLSITLTAKLGHAGRADEVAWHVASTFRPRLDD